VASGASAIIRAGKHARAGRPHPLIFRQPDRVERKEIRSARPPTTISYRRRNNLGLTDDALAKASLPEKFRAAARGKRVPPRAAIFHEYETPA